MKIQYLHLFGCLLLAPWSQSTAKAQEPGTLLWSFDLGNSIAYSPALAPDGTVYVGTSYGIHAITNSGTTASNKWSWLQAASGVHRQSDLTGRFTLAVAVFRPSPLTDRRN